MNLSGNFGGSFAGRPGGSFARAARRPDDILVAADITGWWNTDNRLMGVGSDIMTLTNLGSATSGDLTEATLRPQLATLNGKAVADHVPNDLLRAAASSNMFASGDTDVTMWVAMEIDETSSSQTYASSGGGANTGIAIRVDSTNIVAFTRTNADGNVNANYAHGLGGSGQSMAIMRARYDGANVTLAMNNSVLATTPSASVLSNSGVITSQGNQAGVGQYCNGKIREFLIYNAPVSAADDVAMQTYLAENAGIAV